MKTQINENNNRDTRNNATKNVSIERLNTEKTCKQIPAFSWMPPNVYVPSIREYIGIIKRNCFYIEIDCNG